MTRKIGKRKKNLNDETMARMAAECRKLIRRDYGGAKGHQAKREVAKGYAKRWGYPEINDVTADLLIKAQGFTRDGIAERMTPRLLEIERRAKELKK